MLKSGIQVSGFRNKQDSIGGVKSKELAVQVGHLRSGSDIKKVASRTRDEPDAEIDIALCRQFGLNYTGSKTNKLQARRSLVATATIRRAIDQAREVFKRGIKRRESAKNCLKDIVESQGVPNNPPICVRKVILKPKDYKLQITEDEWVDIDLL